MTLVQTYTRNRATWLSYVMLSYYGYFLNVFGPITPFLKNELNLSYTVSSLHFSAFALGMIGAGLTGHRVIQRFGRWQSLWIGAFGMGVSAIFLIVGSDPTVTIGASFVMGLVGSLMLAIIPSVLSDLHGPMRAVALSEANVISSVFSALAPVLVGWFAPLAFGWRAALLLPVLAALVIRFGFSGVVLPSGSVPSASETQTNRLPRLYWLYWTALVLGVSIEFCMIFWSADYLENVLGMPKADAAQAVSAFLIAMIIGRITGSRLVQRFKSSPVIIAALLIVAVGFLLYWTASAPIFGVVGLFVTGLGVAPLYPLILSLAIGTAGTNIDRASALGSLASGTAIFTLPLILGRLADAVGIRSAYAVIIVLLVVAFAIIRATARPMASSQSN